MALENIPTLGPGSLNANLDKVIVYKNGGSEVATSLLTLANSALNLSGVYLDTVNGRVGIGTNAPTQKLDVVGNINVSTALFINGINTIDRGGDIRYSYVAGSQIHRFFTNSGTERLTIVNDGSVGIGANTPTSRLQIKGSGSTSATTSFLVQNSAGVNSLQVYDDQNASFGGNMNLTSSASPNINIGTGGYPGLKLNNRVAIQEDSSTTVNFGTNYSILRFLLSNSEQARFNTTGFILGGTTNNASAKLQVDSTTQGFLPPRMTTAQKLAIATPATGLMIYDTDLNRPCFYNGTSWTTL